MVHVKLREGKLEAVRKLNEELRTKLNLDPGDQCYLLVDLEAAKELSYDELEKLRQILITNLGRVKRMASSNFGHTIYA